MKQNLNFSVFSKRGFLAVILISVISCMGNANSNEKTMFHAEVQPKQKPIKIGVIGAGWLGGTVGKLLVLSGYDVMFSSRHPEELKAMAEELGPKASVGYPKDAAAFGDVLLFAVPYDALPQLGSDLKDLIKGKIVLDACNGGSGDLGKEVEKYGAGPTSAKYLADTKLVRAFSSEDATAMEASYSRKENKLAVPVAGNDEEAVAIAVRLVRDAGCEPVIAGKLSAGVKFQRGTPAFRANATADKLRVLLNQTKE